MTGWRPPLVAATAIALLMLAGCASSSGRAPLAGAAATGDISSYVSKADLDACPSTTATTATPGGLHPLTLPCLAGGAAQLDLSRLRGPALVNMWASWCGPCVEEVPYLEQLHQATKGRLLVLGVDIQESSRRSPLSFAATVGMHYPSVYDADGAFRAAEHVPAPPATLFVDGDGRVVHRKIGRYHSAAQLKADVARYLGVTA